MKKTFIAFFIGLSLMLASSAIALTIEINYPNAALSGYAGPYAEVTVTRIDSTHATITFASNLMSGGAAYNYLIGDGGSVDVNVNAASWTLGTVTGTNSLASATNDFTVGPYNNSGSGNVSTFGVFNQTITDFDGFSHSATNVTFNLTNTSGTWATDADVLTPNADGYLVAAHIFVWDGVFDDGAAATGFATTRVPEPSVLLLLGAGLIGIAGIRRFK